MPSQKTGAWGRFFSKRLRQLREQAGLTQEAFAERAKMSYKVYQSMEAGRRANPRLETVERLAKLHGVSVHEFFRQEMPTTKLGRVTRRSKSG